MAEAPPQPANSWAEIKQKVSCVRSHFSSKGLRTPSCITFRKVNNGTRLYFVSEPYFKRDTSLLYVDLPSPHPAPTWNPLLEAGFQSLPSSISKEEQLMWERKKVSTWGITSYDIHLQSGRFIFPAGGSLYYCMDNATSQNSVFPYEIQTKTTGARLNATMCPHHPDLVVFVNNGDLWLVNLETRQEERLTFCHNAGAERVSDDPLSAGLPSYVMQEEFSRYTGFWWRPETSSTKHSRSYSILYEELDEKCVEIVRILGFPSSSVESKPEVEEFRYPRADTTNPTSTLKLLNFTLGHNNEILDCSQYVLVTSLRTLFPWHEYLVRAGWTPDGQNIWVQLLDRCQQRLELIIIPKNQFVRCTYSNIELQSQNGSDISKERAPVQVITVEQSDTWVNVNDILLFLPHSHPHQLKFIWASEETGYRHLYLVVVSIHRGGRDSSPPDSTLLPRIISRVQLTHGNWEVLNKQVWFDAQHELVYFHGLHHSVLEPHLYAVSLRRPGEIRKLTTSGFSHSVEMSADCKMMATVFSSVNNLPGCQVFSISQADNTVNGINLQSLGWLLQSTQPEKEYPPPEVFTHVLSTGEELYGLLYKPRMLPGVKYPVMLNVYGGPELQLVSNSFKGLRELRSHLLASQGYVVICIDNRGSLHRGVAWESCLRGKLGQVELQDQLEILHSLASITGYIDLDRVAIHGWSYGGYLSLMALIQYPKEFKVAVAGAPVTSWNYYDTGYTERYLDTPSANPTSYKLGSILNFVDQLPDEDGRLMIMHGAMDENVHFMQHTGQLVNLLIKHGKPYHLQMYPGERHSLRHPDSNEHYLTSLLAFLRKNL
ncbi:dipeptidyl peptidase 9 [Eurytemora carolleeae]|uniref:dipeptidyl peptidase 9 n=1 Tax=Eurytemora carolleeae TaxID=1294199 RepID=UPI000C75BD02|nr:dipeptidyl peptidase 9 [Eurytemora carolleeae]XP_023345698.1 dipeptidyl peptidase 9 [Eurytemora carolleeae]XP_023345699.1 dipeptidyl peptidase 9 [Eurytemora carolleeae]XP_023345700.1 dipeptidyl peptidase 9 [Eurytemora carolleeae]XP_023345701.1 dipeptidyl peptidase 9 [Eurytemora carolleeae]|eukprot:XP_023345697.1 dipeptidyl peptidase 9-like [Eurytemora affinis]